MPTVLTSIPSLSCPSDLTCDLMNALVWLEVICLSFPLTRMELTGVFEFVLG